jgi:hypothetical protein
MISAKLGVNRPERKRHRPISRLMAIQLSLLFSFKFNAEGVRPLHEFPNQQRLSRALLHLH